MTDIILSPSVELPPAALFGPHFKKRKFTYVWDSRSDPHANGEGRGALSWRRGDPCRSASSYGLLDD